MTRFARILVTTVGFALIGVAAQVQDASAQWYCYFCIWTCNLGPNGCPIECSGMIYSDCFNDTIEWCDPGEYIVECMDPS